MKGLSQEDRQRILHNVYDAVSHEIGRCSGEDVRGHAGGVNLIDENLNALVEIARRSTARSIEAYQVQVMWDVCQRCGYQFPSSHCPLRHIRHCVLFVHLAAIIEAISKALVELDDPRYVATHPEGAIRLAQH